MSAVKRDQSHAGHAPVLNYAENSSPDDVTPHRSLKLLSKIACHEITISARRDNHQRNRTNVLARISAGLKRARKETCQTVFLKQHDKGTKLTI